MTLIYKILTADEWQVFNSGEHFAGSAVDLNDGFIHFSTAEQIKETVDRHFSDEHQLFLLEFDSNQLGDSLNWEPSRGGELFPHLYGFLSVGDLIKSAEVLRDSNGEYEYPHWL